MNKVLKSFEALFTWNDIGYCNSNSRSVGGQSTVMVYSNNQYSGTVYCTCIHWHWGLSDPCIWVTVNHFLYIFDVCNIESSSFCPACRKIHAAATGDCWSVDADGGAEKKWNVYTLCKYLLVCCLICVVTQVKLCWKQRWMEQGFMFHSMQNRSLRRRYSQAICWLGAE